MYARTLCNMFVNVLRTFVEFKFMLKPPKRDTAVAISGAVVARTVVDGTFPHSIGASLGRRHHPPHVDTAATSLLVLHYPLYQDRNVETLTRDSFELNMESSSCVDKWRMRAFCQEGFFISRHVTLVSSVDHGVAATAGGGTHAKRKPAKREYCWNAFPIYASYSYFRTPSYTAVCSKPVSCLEETLRHFYRSPRKTNRPTRTTSVLE